MVAKILNKDGKYSVVDSRENEKSYEVSINHVSSTEEQPYIVVNFTAEGNSVGGRTMTKMAVENLIKKAKELGMMVEGNLSLINQGEIK